MLSGSKLVRGMSTTKLSSVTEKDDGTGSASNASQAMVAVKPRPTTVRASKWGRLLGSSSAESGSEGGAPQPPGTLAFFLFLEHGSQLTDLARPIVPPRFPSLVALSSIQTELFSKVGPP